MTYPAKITGTTYEFRSRLKRAGYEWDGEAWTCDYASKPTEKRAIADVRAIGGIRNRGEFSAEIVPA